MAEHPPSSPDDEGGGTTPSVTIVGGGIAGLTAALRLAERGCRVTLYERNAMFGGNLASRASEDGAKIDVYPHMCPGWYRNFWRLLADVGVPPREQAFAPFKTASQLSAGEFPHFTSVRGPPTITSMLRNLFSGVEPPADMFLCAYAAIDMAASDLSSPSHDRLSVASFLEARRYVTDRVAGEADSFITRVWAQPSDTASAREYQTYLANTLRAQGPWLWMARGSAERIVIEPIVRTLERLGVELRPGVELTHVRCEEKRAATIDLRSAAPTGALPDAGWSERVDELILAVPPRVLYKVAEDGARGERLVERIPQLESVGRLRAERVPVLQLHLRRKLSAFPADPVALFGSRLCLSIIDISQTWEGPDAFDGGSVLSVAASAPHLLPGTGSEDDAVKMLHEAGRYLPELDLMGSWGASRHVDWDLTRYEANDDTLLFVNDAATESCRPRTHYSNVRNLALAGDFCVGSIGMTTIECAVETGLLAARSVIARNALGDPVEILYPHHRPAWQYRWLSRAWAPYAYAAMAWSSGGDRLRGLLDGQR